MKIRKEVLLHEAKLSKANFDKSVDIFKRLLERKLSTKLYRFGGESGYAEVKGGVAILYFYDKFKAIRFNYVGGELSSITLWRHFKLNAHGDFTINLVGLNLLQGASELLSIIQSPRTGNLEIPLIEEAVPLTEGKRVTLKQFVAIINRNLASSENLSGVHIDRVKEIAAKENVGLPGALWKVKDKRRGSKNYDISALLDMGEKALSSTDTVATGKIEVQAGDKITSDNASIGGDKKAKAMMDRLSDAIENPTTQIIKHEMLHPDTLFGRMTGLVQLVARGSRNALIIYEAKGAVGKSFGVMQTLKSEGLKENRDYLVIKGKITTTALYQTFYLNRKNKIIVFDDADSMWGSNEDANLLKAALDSYDKRTISWYSPRTVNISKLSDSQRLDFYDALDQQIQDDPEGKYKLPSSFDFESRVIFISNLPESKFDSAILTRSAKIDMTLTQDQMFMRMESILPFLGKKEVPMTAKKEILQQIKSMQKELGYVSMRTYVAAEDLFLSGLPNWLELLPYV